MRDAHCPECAAGLEVVVRSPDSLGGQRLALNGLLALTLALALSLLAASLLAIAEHDLRQQHFSAAVERRGYERLVEYLGQQRWNRRAGQPFRDEPPSDRRAVEQTVENLRWRPPPPPAAPSPGALTVRWTRAREVDWLPVLWCGVLALAASADLVRVNTARRIPMGLIGKRAILQRVTAVAGAAIATAVVLTLLRTAALAGM